MDESVTLAQNTYMAMFILIQEDFITLSVFDKDELLYAEHIDVENKHDHTELLIDEAMELELGEDIDLEDVEVEIEHDMDSLEDFGDIEDLDSLEDIDEFSESKDIEEELHEVVQDEELPSGDEGFNEDYQRFSLIQSSTNHYYKNEKYKSKFIETVYIADSVGVSEDLKRYLEEEMFLSVYIRKIDLATEVCDIAKMELGL